ncbi:YceI family protein [Maritimibacter sp. DP1N21-5]|uniref:YceI family protein n=1 Tax=Maritimibacter sp. DP1N21-5 TaxID=2836867 RepID=UPI001C4649D4|nr:YceI family protein [Maritimibacter sp. DP1N21-5]MBV7407904.1 YceI family protein [Maritimibacter sp. DP1N21-5]
MRHVPALLAFFTLFAAPAAVADPLRYTLDPANSQVSYSVPFGPDQVSGLMPVVRADILLDFVQNSRSTVTVVLDAASATANFPFAEQALKGPKVLDTGAYPTITFQSDQIRMEETAAELDGLVTIRGVTRPVRLGVQVFRQQGTASGDLSKISVHITGTVRRSDFGATGWADMVGDTVTLKIIARLDRA